MHPSAEKKFENRNDWTLNKIPSFKIFYQFTDPMILLHSLTLKNGWNSNLTHRRLFHKLLLLVVWKKIYETSACDLTWFFFGIWFWDYKWYDMDWKCNIQVCDLKDGMIKEMFLHKSTWINPRIFFTISHLFLYSLSFSLQALVKQD